MDRMTMLSWLRKTSSSSSIGLEPLHGYNGGSSEPLPSLTK